MKDRIQKFKDEKLGSRKKEFVETVETVPTEQSNMAPGQNADAMDTSI